MLCFCFIFYLIIPLAAASCEEYNGLIDFYEATHGNTWVNKSGWSSLDSIRNCSSICTSIFPFGLNCSSNGHITSIKFNSTNGNNLTGTIPNSFVSLSHLTTISFNNEVNLYGTIPPSIFDIENITVFQLSNVNISGAISTKISKWTKLESLNIIETKINTFPMNTTIFSQFINLKILEISYNNLLTNIILNDNICQLISMTHFTLFNNGNMQGTLEPCLGNLTNLTSFSLGTEDQYDSKPFYPNISGQVPTEMSKLFNLNSIRIQNTNLSGELLGKPKRLPFENLYDLRVANNKFGGAMDDDIVCEMKLETGMLHNNPYFFRIGYNYFNGTIPSCLFNNWFNQSYKISQYYRQRSIMIFMYHNYFSGTFPSDDDNLVTVGDDCFITEFVLYSNLLVGQLPQWLTKCEFYGIELQSNHLNGTLPAGFKVHYFDLSSNHELTGTIPKGLIIPNINNYTTNNTSWINQTDDDNTESYDDYTDYCYDATYVIIQYCNLYGEIPFDLINFPCLVELNLQENKLTSIERDTEISNEYLENLRLNGNQLKINQIGVFLKYLFYINNNKGLQIIEMHDNKGITGDLSKWDKINKTRQIDLLTLHDCNIYGSLSEKLEIGTINRFTLFNNRLSCNIPSNFIDINNFSFVILGNLFTIADTDTLDKLGWINPEFTKATNLYLTDLDYYKEMLFCIIGLIAALLLWIIAILKSKPKFNNCFDWLITKCVCKRFRSPTQLRYKYKRKSTFMSINTNNNIPFSVQRTHTNIRFLQDNITDYIALFLQSIEKLLSMFSSIILLTMACILTIIYLVNSNYYQCGHVTSQISLTYLHFGDESQKYTLSMTLTIVISLIIFNIFCLYYLISICIYFYHQSKLNNLPTIRHDRYPDSAKFLMSDHDNNDDNIFHDFDFSNVSTAGTAQTMTEYSVLVDQYYSSHILGNESSLYRFGMFIVYSGFYCCGIALSVVYIITTDLPTDNVLQLNYNWQIEMIHSSLAFVLTLINIYIVPKFVDSIIDLILVFNIANCNCKYNCKCKCTCKCRLSKYIWKLLYGRRSDMIAIFRSILSIFTPLFASIIYLNKCGNYWTHLWYPCRQKQLSFETQVKLVTFFGPNNDISTGSVRLSILDNNEVCHVDTIEQVHFTPCLRRFLQLWIPVIALKLIMTAINPHILYLIKTKSIGTKIQQFFEKLLCKSKDNAKNKDNDSEKIKKIDIDIECAMFATKIEFGIIFGFIAPFLWVIIGLGMYSNYYIFGKLYQSDRLVSSSLTKQENKQENKHENLNVVWKLTQFPFVILFVAVGVEQILLAQFLNGVFEQYPTIIYSMKVAFALIDCLSLAVLIVYRCKFK